MRKQNVTAIDKAFKTYGAIATYIRWQEARGRISSEDAKTLLELNKPIYLEYLKWSLPNSLQFAILAAPSKIIEATEMLKTEFLRLAPEFAGSLEKLVNEHGREH